MSDIEQYLNAASSRQQFAAHGMAAGDVLERLAVRTDRGLGKLEVDERRRVFGSNALREPAPRPIWLKFLDQFRSFLIIVLIAAAMLAAFVGNLKDAGVIIAVVLLNAILGFYQEHRAEQSLAALRGMLPVKARVRREAEVTTVEADQLVPGDVVLLEAGDRVAADGRLIFSSALSIDEFSLTGESQPVAKEASAVVDLDAALAERRNIAFMNTLVTRGRGELVVTAIGPETAMGRISSELATTADVRSPLQEQLDVLGKRLGGIALTLVGLLGFLEYLRSVDVVHALLDAVALAVAAVPEGLPVVVTVTLALGMRRMAQHRAIVKKLSSVETLGSTTVICSDKTGTLTLNQMTVRAFLFGRRRFTVSGEGYLTEGTIRPENGEGDAGDFDCLVHRARSVQRQPAEGWRGDRRPDGGRAAGSRRQGGLQQRSFEQPVAPHRGNPVRRRTQVHGDHSSQRGASRCLRERRTGRAACALHAPTGAGSETDLTSTGKSAIEKAYSDLAGRGLRGLLIARRSVSTAR